MKNIGTIANENHLCKIKQDSDGRVFFTADGDIDADGANGQNGGSPAYKTDNTGSELLSNGGMAIRKGKVICAKSWARDIVILGGDNQPKVFPAKMIASITWYRHPGALPDDPAAYVDSETVPYIVVPTLIVQKTAGIVRGCMARVSFRQKSVDCVVADKGPANKIGELSIAAARAIGLPSSPRAGGTSKPELLYELWPGIAAPGFFLQRA
jgi:Fungal chitosanase of glycosyl hydrolase group 75